MGEIAKNIIRHSLSKKLLLADAAAVWFLYLVLSDTWSPLWRRSSCPEWWASIRRLSRAVDRIPSESCARRRRRAHSVQGSLSSFHFCQTYQKIYIVKRYHRQIRNIIHLCSHFSVGLGPSLVWFWSTRLNIYWKIRIIVKISLLYLFSIPLTHVKKGQFLACSKSRFHLDTMYFAVSSV